MKANHFVRVGATLSNLEMTRLCAEAMEYPSVRTEPRRGLTSESAVWVGASPEADHLIYDPLRDDFRAMQLVKRFDMKITKHGRHKTWRVVAYSWTNEVVSAVANTDLNRAIVACVAFMPRTTKP